MVLTKATTRGFYKFLYAGEMETVRLLKRGNDQQEGTVTAYKIFNCRHTRLSKTGEPIHEDEMSSHRTTWHLPAVELERVGISFLNPLDRIVDSSGRYWQPEATTDITVQLFENWVKCDCLRVDP